MLQIRPSGHGSLDRLPAEAIEPWWMETWTRFAASYALECRRERSSEQGLRQELIFCLLGGHGVPFELAASAAAVVWSLDPFKESWTPRALREAVEEELRRPQFEPRRLDGSLRRYRFPRRKAELISAAIAWVRCEGPLAGGLANCAGETEMRDWLCACPGVGLKTASWVLRNCGWASDLAILDVHLIRSMREAGLVGDIRLPRDYEAVEQAFLRWAAELHAVPAALDLFLWDVQRSRDFAIPVGVGGEAPTGPALT